MKLVITLLFLFAVQNGATQTTVPTRISSANPYPETGSWLERDNPGSGFFLDIQNGAIGGAYFGYGDDGENVWLIFSGVLSEVPASPPNFIWELETSLTRALNGECILDCSGPSNNSDREISEVGTIRLVFTGRSLASFSINGGEPRTIVPQTFGVPGFVEFPDTSDTLYPILTGSWVTSFVFVSRTDQSNLLSGTGLLEIGERQLLSDETGEFIFYPATFSIAGTDPQDVETGITCRDDGVCTFFSATDGNIGSFSSFAVNISDSRLTASRPDFGDPPSTDLRFDAFRLGYD